MTRMVAQTVYRVWGWDSARLQWTLRSHHPSREQAQDAAHQIIDTQLIRVRISEGTRKVAVESQAPAPTAAKAFRENQADAVVLRRQTHAYFKSGCCGNEILHVPKPQRH
jgi:hypothetical protein